MNHRTTNRQTWGEGAELMRYIVWLLLLGGAGAGAYFLLQPEDLTKKDVAEIDFGSATYDPGLKEVIVVKEMYHRPRCSKLRGASNRMNVKPTVLTFVNKPCQACRPDVPKKSIPKVCRKCAGQGNLICPTCNGGGKVTTGQGDLICGICNGGGKKRCPICHGRGK
jgi:hypothetical protein